VSVVPFLFALAAYVVASAAWKLWTNEGADTISLISIPIMYFLARQQAASC
jgi:hypothetical protein